MSRIGRQPVVIPNGVKSDVKDGVVSIEGPKGKLKFKAGAGVTVSKEGTSIIVKVEGSDRQSNANYGTARAVINNMVKGAATGWKRTLEMNGVGFGAKMSGQKLSLTVGFTHDVIIDLPKELTCKISKTTIELESADRQLVGEYAARVRRVQPPEPYLGKGIKYTEETVRRKAGKTAAKK